MWIESFPYYPRNINEASFRTQGSTLTDYLHEFWRIPPEYSVNNLISEKLQLECPVIIDLMADTSALREIVEEYRNGKPITGIAVTLTDPRSLTEQFQETDLGLSLITGDLYQPETWQKIVDTLGTNRADLIMERGLGGLHFVGTNREFYCAVMQLLWNMLADEGMLIAQTPPFKIMEDRYIPITYWKWLLQNSGIKYGFVDKYRSRAGGYYGNYGLFMVLKDANLQLPTIP